MTPYSEWSSPTIASIVRQMNQPSDNYIAETLMKGLGSEFGRRGLDRRRRRGRARDARALRASRPRIVDGSGLSRANRTTPREVVRLLTGMDASEAAVAFDAVARRRRPQRHARPPDARHRRRRTAAGPRPARCATCRALAGFCDTTGGERVAFAFLMNGVWPASARVLQDRMTVALARYDA